MRPGVGAASVGHEPRGVTPSAEAVGYASDTKRLLSATPATPIDAIDGVGDRARFMTMA
jgi:hypothetical protein